MLPSYFNTNKSDFREVGKSQICLQSSGKENAAIEKKQAAEAAYFHDQKVMLPVYLTAQPKTSPIAPAMRSKSDTDRAPVKTAYGSLVITLPKRSVALIV